jgi:hypothetical protein
MRNTTFERARTSIGLSNFVEFYEDYLGYYQKDERLRKADKKRLAQRLYELNPKATSPDAQTTRIDYSVDIFENGWVEDMFKAAIESDHHSVTKEIQVRAKHLLNGRKI